MKDFLSSARKKNNIKFKFLNICQSPFDAFVAVNYRRMLGKFRTPGLRGSDFGIFKNF